MRNQVVNRNHKRPMGIDTSSVPAKPECPVRESESSQPALLTAYEELCRSYHAIEDFRAKLLALLPFASGAGIFLLLDHAKEASLTFAADYLRPVGIFGFVVTLGLFCYEIRGIQRCNGLINLGRSMEGLLKVRGQFAERSPPVGGFIGSTLAARLIYPAVVSAWTYLALALLEPKVAALITAVVFLVFFVGSFALNLNAE